LHLNLVSKLDLQWHFKFPALLKNVLVYRLATRLLALPPKALRRRYLSRGGWLPHFFYDFVITFDTILMKNMHNCYHVFLKKSGCSEALQVARAQCCHCCCFSTSGLSKLQPSTISSFSPRKKLRVRFENGKIFSDSRGNRQANWNLDNFLHLFTPCNLPTFGEVVTWKSWRLARQLKLLREEQSKPS